MTDLSRPYVAISVLWIFVFFSNETFAQLVEFSRGGFGYIISGQWNYPLIGTQPFGSSSGHNTRFSGRYDQGFGGELGLFFSQSQLSVSIGIEYLEYRPEKTLLGLDDIGSQNLFNLRSRINAFVPKGSFEYHFLNLKRSRFTFGLGFGLGFVQMKNHYKMSSDGLAEWGVDDYTERGKGRGLFLRSELGYEVRFADQVTLLLAIGYRYAPISRYTSKKSWTGIMGNIESGEKLLNHGGDGRRGDFTAWYARFVLRFFLTQFKEGVRT